jgi:hypothetical protein
MGRGFWVAILNYFVAKVQEAFNNGTGSNSVSNQLASSLGRSTAAVANRYAMVVELVLLPEAKELLGLAYNGINNVVPESQNMARIDYMNTGMPHTFSFILHYYRYTFKLHIIDGSLGEVKLRAKNALHALACQKKSELKNDHAERDFFWTDERTTGYTPTRSRPR